MFYDKTDVKTRILSLKKLGIDLPGEWEQADVDLPVGLTHTWTAGGRLFRALNRIDFCQGFDNWYEAWMWLANVCPEEKISEIRYWGHGGPGRVWMGNESLGPYAPVTSKYKSLISRVQKRLTDDALIWFRTCSTFGADAGRVFAQNWAMNMNCRVAGHTHAIGFLQAGLHSLKPGDEPYWIYDEGIEQGTAEKPKKMSGSWLSSPNLITCLHGEIPNDW